MMRVQWSLSGLSESDHCTCRPPVRGFEDCRADVGNEISLPGMSTVSLTRHYHH
jgi:hypothetical protein